MKTREKRIKKIELSLGSRCAKEPFMFFFDSPMYNREPDSLICGAAGEGLSWERSKDESVKDFEERIKKDLMATGWPRTDGKFGFMLFLNRDHTGLPPTSHEFPAYTPYSEVLKRLEAQKGTTQEQERSGSLINS